MKLRKLVRGAEGGAGVWRTLHMALAWVWSLLVVPTVAWWHSSVLWVGLISCYANAVGHLSAWQATRAEEKVDDKVDDVNMCSRCGGSKS